MQQQSGVQGNRLKQHKIVDKERQKNTVQLIYVTQFINFNIKILKKYLI